MYLVTPKVGIRLRRRVASSRHVLAHPPRVERGVFLLAMQFAAPVHPTGATKYTECHVRRSPAPRSIKMLFMSTELLSSALGQQALLPLSG
jgi:hypothetical protein